MSRDSSCFYYISRLRQNKFGEQWRAGCFGSIFGEELASKPIIFPHGIRPNKLLFLTGPKHPRPGRKTCSEWRIWVRLRGMGRYAANFGPASWRIVKGRGKRCTNPIASPGGAKPPLGNFDFAPLVNIFGISEGDEGFIYARLLKYCATAILQLIQQFFLVHRSTS